MPLSILCFSSLKHIPIILKLIDVKVIYPLIFPNEILLIHLKYSIVLAFLLLILLLTYILFKKTKLFKKQTIDHNYQFANIIVNNGNSLIITTNKKGEVSFCSDSIMYILGYDAKDVLGFGFWQLTEDPDFIGEAYHEDYVDGRLYVRKLKCKNGDYKHIQWKDKRYSEDIIIGIGHDITEQINFQNQYRDLIESATDLIYEINSEGKFTYTNPFTQRTLGYTNEEILNSDFTDFIKKEYREQVVEFYANLPENQNDYPDLVFPVLKKDGNIIWVSQKVSVKKEEDESTFGYSVIARDITLIKSLEAEHYSRAQKVRIHNETIKTLTSKSYSNKDSFNSVLKNILMTASVSCTLDRVSYWSYSPDKLRCENLYFLELNKFEKNFFIDKENHQKYFLAIERNNQIVASNAYENPDTQELCYDYFPKGNIKSLLDTPIFINGKLTGILCFEKTDKPLEWDNEDINFSRSISDLIAIALEANMRFEVEQKLTYKSDVLQEIIKNTEQFLLSKNTSEILEGILNTIGNVTKVDKLTYFENNGKEKTLIQKFRWVEETNSLAPPNPKIASVPYHQIEDIMECMFQNKPYYNIVRKIKNEKTKEILTSIGTKSILILPITVKDQLYGFIAFVVEKNDREWMNDEINILENLAKSISHAIERNINENIIHESEEKFKLLANNIPGTVHLSKYDDKWSKIYLNDEIENLTGYPKSEFLENKIYYMDLVHPQDIKIVLNKAKELFKEKKKIHLVYRIIHKKGHSVWVEEFGEPILKDGEIAFLGGIFIDITQKMEADKAVKEKEYAEAANLAKSEFLANMSHEIRTPLNGIIGFTDLLMHTKLEEIQKEYMNTINLSANALMEVINNILDFSKIESGKLELNIEKVDVKEIANQVVDLVKFDSNQKNISLKLKINPDVPIYIWLDSIRLKQVLINLLSNSVKFTEAGQIEFTISIQKVITEKEAIVRFSIKDSGIGIKDKNQEKIFHAFSQEDSSTTRRFGGTGLGLSISNQLLALMESKLELKSEYGIGSEFYFDIKVKACNEPEKDIENEDKPIPKTANSNTIITNDSKTIFLVEDNAINMLLAKTLMLQIIPNAKVIELVNGEDAVEKINTVIPDLILMDIQMPIMNGYEATIAIRKLPNTQAIPIIALTAGTVVGEKEKCINAGMNDYISKPVDKENLATIIQHWLNINS